MDGWKDIGRRNNEEQYKYEYLALLGACWKQ